MLSICGIGKLTVTTNSYLATGTARALGFSRGLGEERAHEWTKSLATARRACKLARLVLANRQGESHRTLAFVAVVFVHGHRGPSDWPAPRSVTRTKRSNNIAFRSPGKRQCGECHLLNDLIRPP